MNAHRLHVASKRRRQVYMKKIILMFTACVLVFGLSIFLSNDFVDAHGNSEEASLQHKYYTSIEITSGDTLWGIAEKYMDENYDSIYEYIYELKDINGLESDDIQDAQYLTVAYYDTFQRE